VSLKKWVETREEKRRVAMNRETLRIQRVPVYQPVEGVELGTQEVNVTLFDEEPMITKTVVAKERISLQKDRPGEAQHGSRQTA
jgi:stress response protein YsnF